MRILLLDVASHEGLLACSTEERIVVHRTIDHRVGDHELVPLIEAALREVGWSYKDLTHLACVIGPGGFTSLRVGVSCINALSWSLKIPVVGIHLSDLYAMLVVGACHPEVRAGSMVRGSSASASEHLTMTPCGPRMGDTQPFLWLHSTKRTELFVRGFGHFAKEWPDSTQINVGDLLSKLQSPETYNLKPITYTGELLPEHQKLIEDAGAVPLRLPPLTGALPQFLTSCEYREQTLQPWYGRGW